jgi:hypothetical protein
MCGPIGAEVVVSRLLKTTANWPYERSTSDTVPAVTSESTFLPSPGSASEQERRAQLQRCLMAAAVNPPLMT